MTSTSASEPIIVAREAVPYAGIRTRLPMAGLPGLAHRIPELIGGVAAQGLEPTGAPFFRYHVVDMEGVLDVEVGIPIAGPVKAEGDIKADTVPAGRYATLTHVGPPHELQAATARLLAWGDEHGVDWDRSGATWGGRIEIYLTDPREEPDPANWRTELAFRVAG